MLATYNVASDIIANAVKRGNKAIYNNTKITTECIGAEKGGRGAFLPNNLFRDNSECPPPAIYA